MTAEQIVRIVISTALLLILIALRYFKDGKIQPRDNLLYVAVIVAVIYSLLPVSAATIKGTYSWGAIELSGPAALVLILYLKTSKAGPFTTIIRIMDENSNQVCHGKVKLAYRYASIEKAATPEGDFVFSEIPHEFLNTDAHVWVAIDGYEAVSKDKKYKLGEEIRLIVRRLTDKEPPKGNALLQSLVDKVSEGHKLHRKSRVKAAYQCYQEAKTIGDTWPSNMLKSNEWYRAYGGMLIGLSFCHRSWSNYDLALATILEAQNIFQRIDDPERQATNYANIGNAYIKKLMWKEAMTAFERAKDLLPPKDSKEFERFKTTSQIVDVGVFCLKLERDPHTAKFKLLEEELERDVRIGNRYGVPEKYQNLAMKYFGKNDLNLARSAATKARDYNIGFGGGDWELATNFHLLAEIDIKEEKLDSAFKNLLEATRLHRKVENVESICHCLVGFGGYLLGNQRYSDAVAVLAFVEKFIEVNELCFALLGQELLVERLAEARRLVSPEEFDRESSRYDGWTWDQVSAQMTVPADND